MSKRKRNDTKQIGRLRKKIKDLRKKIDGLESKVPYEIQQPDDPAEIYFMDKEVTLVLWDYKKEEYLSVEGVYRGTGHTGSKEVIVLDIVDDADPSKLVRHAYNADNFYDMYTRQT